VFFVAQKFRQPRADVLPFEFVAVRACNDTYALGRSFGVCGDVIFYTVFLYNEILRNGKRRHGHGFYHRAISRLHSGLFENNIWEAGKGNINIFTDILIF
jgi:hypothetical protein